MGVWSSGLGIGKTVMNPELLVDMEYQNTYVDIFLIKMGASVKHVDGEKKM